MDPVIAAIFLVVYAGMVLGELPGLRLDRTGIALLGVTVDWRTHARVGVPVTIGTLAVAALWLWARA